MANVILGPRTNSNGLSIGSATVPNIANLSVNVPPALPPVAYSGVLSAAVYNSNGSMVRTIYAAQVVSNWFYADSIWDGTNDDGTVAASGSYTIKTLKNNCTYTWEGVIGNNSPNHTNHSLVNGYVNPSVPIHAMAITDAGEMYYTSVYSERVPVMHWTTTANPLVMNYITPFDPTNPDSISFRANYSSQWACCSDGTNVYFAAGLVQDSSISFAWAVDCATKRSVTFSSGTSYSGFSAVSYLAGPTPGTYYGGIQGIAVQKTGNFLFILRAAPDGIYVVNKTTGAAVHTDTTSTVSPVSIATNPTSSTEVWISYAASGIVIDRVGKFSVDGSGNLTLLTLITGFSRVTSMAVSPDGATLLVCDGGTSQQVKAFNTSDGSVKTAFGTSGVFGSAGGYANSPTVTLTKFMFVDNSAWGSGSIVNYIAFAPDGSWWLGDPGNYRNLHFTSGNTPTYIEQVCYIPSFYGAWVDFSDPTRVFADWLEFSIDYSKTLDPTNGSWTLLNNWSYNIPSQDIYTAMRFTGTYSNGRRYARVNKGGGAVGMYELTATGLRAAGANLNGVQIYVDAGMNQYFTTQAVTGGQAQIYKLPFTGFDGSNNPTWGPSALYETSPVLPVNFPTTGNSPIYFNPVEPTASGIVPIYDYSTAHSGANPERNHFGGIDYVNGNCVFSTAPATHSNFGVGLLGSVSIFYPPDHYWDIFSGSLNGGGQMRYHPGGTNIYCSYMGETWGANQTNVWYHWHESGMFVGRFGPAIPYNGAASLTRYIGVNFKGVVGAAGNAFGGGLATYNGVDYLYHNDEWYHSGLHRWRVDNLTSIYVENHAVVWDSTTYTPVSPPASDHLAGLPFNTVNIPNNTAGWTRSPTADTTTGFTIYTSTNAYVCDFRQSSDIFIETGKPASGADTRSATTAAAYASLQRSLSRTGSGDWHIDTTISYPNPSDRNLLYRYTNCYIAIDILDATGKIIVRVESGQDTYTPSNTGMYVNNVKIPFSLSIIDWEAYQGAWRDLNFISNIAGNSIQVNYGDGDYVVTTSTVYDVGANIATPTTFKLTAIGGKDGNGGYMMLKKLNYY